MQDFQKLNVWKKAHQLTLAIYVATRIFPQKEAYGLTRQVKRSCASIPANIAEGCGRGSDPDFCRFLQFAMGSASELKYHLLLARDLKFMSVSEHARLDRDVAEIMRMLSSLIRRVTAIR